MSDERPIVFPTKIAMRDYLAAKVLPAIYTESAENEDSYASAVEIAEQAYRIADAMLKVREQK
jgi:hypothetical protein